MNINTKKISKFLPTLVSGLLTILFYSMGWGLLQILGIAITGRLFIRLVYDTFIKKYSGFDDFGPLVFCVTSLSVIVCWIIYFQFICDKLPFPSDGSNPSDLSISRIFEFMFFVAGCILTTIVLSASLFSTLLKDTRQLFVSFWEYRKKIPTLEDLENSKRIVTEADRVVSIEQE